MNLEQMSAEEWAARCAQDAEFLLAARHWSGGLRLRMDEHVLALFVVDGQALESSQQNNAAELAPGIIEYTASEAVWRELLAAKPKRFHNDLMAHMSASEGLAVQGDPLVHAQYYPAIMRAVELLRPASQAASQLRPGELGEPGRFDSPVGRYVHLQLDGVDHRIYFEEAGQGIPVLLQHTAGCHGGQWRHLFEMPQITEHFRLIAYDLPYHGKSVPPVQQQWWAQDYRLRGAYLRSIPLQLAQVLQLDAPVFMGCSVGGLLALDLAHKHADTFRAVIAVEGALHIPGDTGSLGMLWHPQVSNEYKARLMQGLMSPHAPEAYRKETSFVYASGWPPSFLGDLAYYMDEFDLRDCAGEIDTQKVGVHILSGEYDYSGTRELGKAAHAAIDGSTWTPMQGVGHFPMSEDPVAFAAYLEPILKQITRQ